MNQCADIHNYAMKSSQKKKNESYYIKAYFLFYQNRYFLNCIVIQKITSKHRK